MCAGLKTCKSFLIYVRRFVPCVHRWTVITLYLEGSCCFLGFFFIYGVMCGGNEQICEQMRRLRKSKRFSGAYLWSHCWYLCTEARVGAKLELKVFRS